MVWAGAVVAGVGPSFGAWESPFASFVVGDAEEAAVIAQAVVSLSVSSEDDVVGDVHVA